MQTPLPGSVAVGASEILSRSTSTARVTVLVVEDEALVRLNATQMLESAGYIVCEADGAAAGLAQLRLHPEVSVLFTDINMPGDLDGLELARQVHELRPDMHLILTSGLKRPCGDELCGGAFVAKPYRDELITDMIFEATTTGNTTT